MFKDCLEGVAFSYFSIFSLEAQIWFVFLLYSFASKS